MAGIGICHKRKCSIIRAIIDNETYDTYKLVEITGFTDVEVSASVLFYKRSDYVVCRSMTDSDIYYLYNKNTLLENQLKLSEDGYVSGRFHIDNEASNALVSFGFKRY